jgi:hypothetical protein
MIPRTPPAARTALDHKRLKTGPFLVAHQTPDQGSLPKSNLESDTSRFGNPLCQQLLGRRATENHIVNDDEQRGADNCDDKLGN